jgi:hypothetical protein
MALHDSIEHSPRSSRVVPIRHEHNGSELMQVAPWRRRALDSVAAQSAPPALWVVVDDGSTDETPANPGGATIPENPLGKVDGGGFESMPLKQSTLRAT